MQPTDRAADRQLPNGEQAVVSPEKVQAYLLNRLHAQNKGKAQFFEQVGYNPSQPEQLAQDLKLIAITGRVTATVPTEEGVKYVVIGRAIAPNRREYSLTTVWMLETDQTAPRLITAYPNRN